MNAIEPVPQELFNPREFRNTVGQFATGVTVVSTVDGGHVHGMTANSFTSVSLEPPLILVSIDNRARMLDLLRNSGRFGLSILAEDQQHISNHFAGKPQDGLEQPFDWHDGIPLIEGALARLVCDVESIYAAGDHTLFLGRVQHFERRVAQPLVFHGGQYGSLWNEQEERKAS